MKSGLMACGRLRRRQKYSKKFLSTLSGNSWGKIPVHCLGNTRSRFLQLIDSAHFGNPLFSRSFTFLKCTVSRFLRISASMSFTTGGHGVQDRRFRIIKPNEKEHSGHVTSIIDVNMKCLNANTILTLCREEAQEINIHSQYVLEETEIKKNIIRY